MRQLRKIYDNYNIIKGNIIKTLSDINFNIDGSNNTKYNVKQILVLVIQKY